MEDEESKVLVNQSCPALCDPMDCSHQDPLSMAFSRQEYWSGLPFTTPGHLPDPGTEPVSFVSPALAADSLPLCHLGSSHIHVSTLLLPSIPFCLIVIH